MTVDTNDPRPPYVQVADGLRSAIRSGDLAPGVRLASGRELASQWGVALMTLQKAIDLLRDEGLVYSQQGRGVFVALGRSTSTDDLLALQEVVEELRRRLDVVEARLGSGNGAST